MPFPSRGCRTCRQRRVKCDEVRPSCGPCVRLSKTCGGYDHDSGPFTFIDENAHAGGVNRRSRQCKARPIFPSADRTKKDIVLEDLSTAHLIPQSMRSIAPSMTPSLAMPLDVEAVNVFLSRYAQPRGEKTNSMWDHILAISDRTQRSVSQADTVFSHAMRASSLAFFAKIRHEPAILGRANHQYVKALHSLKSVISTTSYSTSNQVLLAVLLLSNYENMSARPEEPHLYCESFQHMDGAIALLYLRRQQEQHKSQSIVNSSLDRDVRSQIVRQAVYRDVQIPIWLRAGEAFGLEGRELLLDNCIVKAALLRNHVNRYMQIPIRGVRLTGQVVSKQLERMLSHAQLLDKQLLQWSKNTPSDYVYEAFMYPTDESEYRPSYYCGMTSTYTSMAHATNWNRYRGARLIIGCIITKIAKHVLDINEHTQRDLQGEIERTQYYQQALVDEICASVPYVLEDGSSTTRFREAFNLSWPLIIVLAVQSISSEQRKWVRDQLRLISTITASGMFERVANLDFHLPQHQCR